MSSEQAASGVPLRGLMMDAPLQIADILRFAERHHPHVEVVSVTEASGLHRCTFRDIARRARQLAAALSAAGIRPGDRVATLAWNDHRHLELYYAVSCMGAVLHTINPRLFPTQLAYIIDHAKDRLLFLDPGLRPVLEGIRPQLRTLERVVLLAQAQPGETDYETFLATGREDYAWPDLDERTASALCYTSGTTGQPKGVLYSHRSTVLHGWAICAANGLAISSRDTVLPVVPMFHANAWGLPYAALMAGAKLVLPGRMMGDARMLQQLIEGEGVTFAAAVPTVWQGLLQYLDESGSRIEALERVAIGGSACPVGMMNDFRDRHGVQVLHAWGMTETSPLGTVNHPPRGFEALAQDTRDSVQARQGCAVFGVRMKIVDDTGAELPWDGRQFGALHVQGPRVASGYFEPEEPLASHDEAGWFATGDVATIDADGNMQITDRTKDLIKSGGEWISSIELENSALAHPDVLQAAAIAVPHPKWSERPLLVVVPRPGAALDPPSLLRWLEGRVARWWIPDEVVVVEHLPLTATGKVSKYALRQRFAAPDSTDALGQGSSASSTSST